MGVTVMEVMGMSSSVVRQRASPWRGQVPRWRCCRNRSYSSLPYYQKLLMKLDAPPRMRCSGMDRTLVIRTERCSFGVAGSRFRGLEGGRLGLVSSRTVVVRAQKEDKEGQELDKLEKKSSESWASSFQRANTVTRIFMATLVWIFLFLWISVANSETGGRRPGRRGPRK